MITAIVGMALCGTLFVLFTAVRPRHACSGDTARCGACHGVCELAGAKRPQEGSDVQ